MQRKISDVENKLLLLFSVDNLGSVTNLQLLQFMVDNSLMDYITLQLALGELVEAGQLALTPHALGPLYSLTDKGRQALALFGRRVPNSRRMVIGEAAAQWRERFVREKNVLADFRRLGEADYGLTLRLLENGLILLRLDIHLPARNMADLFSRRWPGRAQAIYQMVMDRLSQGYRQGERPAPLPAFARLVPQAQGGPLLTLSYAPDGREAFLLSLPAQDAPSAGWIAGRFEKEAAGMLNFIMAAMAKE